MRKRLAGSIVAATVAMVLGVATAPAAGQAPAAAAQAGAVPRAPDGKPDFSGIWQVMSTANWNIQDHPAEKGVPGGQGVVEGNEIPYLPAALAKKNENYKNRATADPVAKCYLPGVPRIMYMPYPFQIFQTPNYIAMVFEFVHAVRHVYLNSKHLDGPIEWWMGDSRARWDGDTLVVDAIHFNADTWFDSVRQSPQRSVAPRRTLFIHRPRSHQLRSDGRGPQDLFAALEDDDAAVSPRRAQCPDPRLRVPRVRRAVRRNVTG